MCHYLRNLRNSDGVPLHAQEDRKRWEAMGRPSLTANFFSPSMYGSLPKALSHEERLSISRNTPMSASLREVRNRTPVRPLRLTHSSMQSLVNVW